METSRILVVDDEVTLTVVLEDILTEHGCEVRVANSAEEGLALLAKDSFDVALLDIVLPGMNGLQLLSEIKQRAPSTEVLMMTSHSSVDTVLEAIRCGAYDYLQKPFEDIEEVWINVKRVLEKTELTRRNHILLEEKEVRNRELSAAVMRMTSFIEAGHAMSEFDALPRLLDFFVGLVATELGVKRASLMLLDDARSALVIAAHRGLEAVDVDSVRVPLGEGIAGQVAQDGEPFLVRDATPARMTTETTLSGPIALCVPITSASGVLGVINITNRDSGAPFHDADVDYLAGMAGQLAVAIERARHFQSLQEAYDSLKDTQQQLIFSERLKAIGEMAAGIAHDFNNDLSVILGKTQIALRRLDHPEVATLEHLRADLDTILKISMRSAETVRRVQDYTRIRRDSHDDSVDLNTVVREAVEITRPKWKEEVESRGVTLTLDFALNKIGPVSGNVHEMTQVVTNLIFNAVEAMPDGGRLSFRTEPLGEEVVLEIADTGVGMDSVTASKVFEPFFTTKEKGNGLGTSIVYGIVSRHGGSIAVSSREGEGTTFRLTFPRRQSAATPSAKSSLELSAPQRTARILLIEDEAMVRDTLEDLLVSEGHSVTPAPCGERGLALFGPGRYDVVITDLNMPDMTGLELVEALKGRDPDMPTILLSGWSVQQEEDRVKAAGVDFVLTKPCTIDSLSRTVQKALSLHVGV